jgi:hypothetical protein
MIFGNQSPKFQVSSTDVLLDYAVVEDFTPDYGNILNEGSLDRKRSFVTKPLHINFVVVVHLHRYIDPQSKYDEIIQHLNATCQVWRHRDGAAFQDTGGADADFVFIEAQPFYLTTTDYADALRLVFKSIDVIELSDYKWLQASFTRDEASQTAWHYNSDTGLWVNTTEDQLRYTEGRRGKMTGILIEGARQNYVGSDWLDWDPWTKVFMTVDDETTETPDIFGTNLINKLTAGATNDQIVYDTGQTAGDDWTASIFVKSGQGDINGSLFVAGSVSGTEEQEFVATPDGPYNGFSHVQVYADTSGYSGNINIDVLIDTNTEIIYAGPAQMEKGKFASTPTNTTRPLEKLIISPVGLIGRDSGSLGFWFKPEAIYNVHDRLDLITIGTNDSNKHIYLRVETNGNLNFFGYKLNSTTAAFSVAVSMATYWTQDEWIHLAVTWDFLNANSGKIYVNGVLRNTSSNDPASPSDIGTNFAIGSTIAGGAQAFGVFDELWTDKTLGLGPVLTDAEILQIYNGGRPARCII